MTTSRAAAAGARAVAVEAESERGLAMRILLHSPKDMIAGLLAFAAVSAIIANALFLQTGHHPSPMFGSVVAMPAAGIGCREPVAASASGRCRRPSDTGREPSSNQAGSNQGCSNRGPPNRGR